MAMNLAQDWRLHRRCDQQLAELGLGVDSELDIARRDVYGAATNLCKWRNRAFSWKLQIVECSS